MFLYVSAYDASTPLMCAAILHIRKHGIRHSLCSYFCEKFGLVCCTSLRIHTGQLLAVL
jgi:hypothetical protein